MPCTEDSLLATGRTLIFLPGYLGSPKIVHGGRTTAVPAVLVYQSLELDNPSLQVSAFLHERGDGALEIIDDCKENRDILHSVLGKRSILNTCLRRGYQQPLNFI
jgi:hypothetical protein